MTLCNTSTDPFYNQALEEFLFQAFPREDTFYLWRNRPAVVVGCYQNICREVPVGALRRRGIPVVRRITGGGTVYHDLGNLNYTFITSAEGGVDYNRFLGPVVEALRAVGVPARKNNVCDIAIGEEKISGSAQRSAGGRLLHHGTLLFQSDLEAVDRLTAQGKNSCVRSKGVASAICPVTNIRPHLEHDMELEEFQARLLERLDPGPVLSLTAEQEAEVRRLRDGKYLSWEWTWGRTPPFSYEREGTFAGAPIRVSYQARRGILSGAAVDCPSLDGPLAARLLEGARLDPEGFSQICKELAGDRWEELLDLLL